MKTPLNFSAHDVRAQQARKLARLFSLLFLCAIASIAPAQVLQFGRINQIGGECRALAVHGNYALLGEGTALSIVDVTSPTLPVLISRLRLPDTIQDIAVQGTLASLVTTSGTLVTVHVGDLSAPEIISSFPLPAPAHGIALSGTLAWLACAEQGVYIIDLSNPVAPVVAGSIDTPGSAWNITISGGRAYVADQAGGARIFDLTNPVNPQPLGSYVDAQEVWGTAAANNLAYMADFSKGLLILDTASTGTPVLKSTLALPGACGVTLAGNTAYVSNIYGGPSMVDVTTATKPVLKSSFSLTSSAYRTVAANNLIYVADYAHGLKILNTFVNGTVTSLREVGAFRSPGMAYDVAIEGNLACLSEESVGYWFFNIATAPELDPMPLGTLKTLKPPANMIMKDSMVYGLDGHHLQIVDAHDPTSATLKSNYFFRGDARDFDLAGTMAYVVDTSDGLQLLDVSQPSLPLVVGRLKTPHEPAAVSVRGTLAFLAHTTAGLQVIDVSNPALPQAQATFESAGITVDIAVSNNLALLAKWHRGVDLINISDPQNPVFIANFPTPGLAGRVRLEDNFAYISLTNTLDPTFTMKNGNNTGIPRPDILGSGFRDDIANGWYQGLLVLDVSFPASPQQKALYYTAGGAGGARPANGLTYVTDLYGGLSILGELRNLVEQNWVLYE